MKNLFLLSLIFCSCSILHKHKTVAQSRIDSVSVVSEKKDSTVSNSQTALHKDSSASQDEVVIDWGFTVDTTKYNGDYYDADSGSYYEPKNPNEYFVINPKTGEIKASKVPVKVTIKGTKNAFNFDSLSNHSQIQTSDVKSDSNRVTKSEKTVTKNKDVKKIPVFQLVLLGLLVLVIIWVVKNRKSIWAWIVHLVTGL